MGGARRTVPLAMALLMVLVTSVATAAGQSAALTLSPTTGESGATVIATGAGFEPTGTVELLWNNVEGELLATGAFDREGGFEIRFSVPASAGVGVHVVLACRDRNAATCREEAKAEITVVAPTTTTITQPSTTTTAPSTTTTTQPSTTTTEAATTTTTQPSTTTQPGIGSTTTTAASPPTSAIGVTTTEAPPQTAVFESTTTSLATPSDVGVTTTTVGPSGDLFEPNAEEWPDLEVIGFEITQGIQDLQNRMPLVAWRPTWVRVYVAADRLPESNGQADLTTGGVGSQWSYDGWDDVEGALLLERGGVSTVVYPTNGPVTAFGDGGDRLDRNSTLNFPLPIGWTDDGEMNVTAFIWSGQPTSPVDWEPNAANNFGFLDVEFHEAAEPTAIAIRLHNRPAWSEVSESYLMSALADIETSILTYHPVSGSSISSLLAFIGPGNEVPDEVEDGLWDLSERPWEANQRLGWFHTFWDLDDEEWLIGIVPDAASSWGGYANPGHHAFWTRKSTTVPAHEFGHNRGLAHVACRDIQEPFGVPDELLGGAIDLSYGTAFPNCSLAPVDPAGYYGFEVLEANPRVISNDPNASPDYYPFMSYESPEWMDPYHTCRLLDSYGVPCEPAEIGVPPAIATVDFGQSDDLLSTTHNDIAEFDGPIMVTEISQEVTPANNAEHADAARIVRTVLIEHPTSGVRQLLTGQAEWIAYTAPPPANGVQHNQSDFDFLIQRVDDAGAPLAVVPVPQDGSGHGDSDVSEFSSLLVAIPWPEGAAGLELITGAGEVVERRTVGAAPSVAIETLTVGAEGIHLEWSGSSADGSDIAYFVQISADGGSTWRALEANTSATSLTAGADHALAGGDEVIVRVTATAGLSSASVESDPFSLPDAPPRLTINASETEFGLHAVGRLTASAYDPEDRTLTDITWASDVEGPLGDGRTIETRSLSEGSHIITATVTDSAGNVATDSLAIEVVDVGTVRPMIEGDNPTVDAILRGGLAELETRAAHSALRRDESDAASPTGDTSSPLPLAAAAMGLLLAAGGVYTWRRRST